ncbi:class I SAM-dependent methyltransferase [Methylococcaceae bacterium WWC4]|nr:class I SAM-dependent methyltransferase [Methylococcaceae bacterium WWC4]
MVRKLSTRELREIVSIQIPRISDCDRDEMAIPSYLHWNPLIRWLMWKRYESISNLSSISTEMSILEFGCGTGVFLPELATNSNTVYAIDIFPEYAEILTEKLNLPVRFVRDLSEMPDNSLDLVIAADVLEHLNNDDLESYMVIFSKKLKIDGRLIVSGPTENIFYKIGRVIAGFADKGDYHHTNINLLIDAIGKHFDLQQTQNLPSKFSPCLFKVCEFKQPQSKC